MIYQKDREHPLEQFVEIQPCIIKQDDSGLGVPQILKCGISQSSTLLAWEASRTLCLPSTHKSYPSIILTRKRLSSNVHNKEEVYVAQPKLSSTTTQKATSRGLKELKYLKGTINMGLWDTFLGDNLVSWMSKKQNCTAMSSAEAEYVALSASNYITKPSHWPIPIKEAHVDFEEAQWNVGFCTKILTKEAQTSHQWNDTLAILRCPQLDQTATNEAQMIGEMIGQD
ncbi:hypothetical protein Tco_1501258 [Tanacetum coccineum]